jgi:hypothetical protein
MAKAPNAGYTALSRLVNQIEGLIKEWNDDPDTTTAEYTLTQIQHTIDRQFMRPERRFTDGD